jgi:hypothetical protein
LSWTHVRIAMASGSTAASSKNFSQRAENNGSAALKARLAGAGMIGAKRRSSQEVSCNVIQPS